MKTTDPIALLGVLADEARMRIFAAVLLGARSTGQIAAAGGARGEKDALRLLSRLESAGLVSRAEGGWRAHPEILREAAAAAATPRTYVDHGVSDPDEAAVLRTFLPEGRLVQMPTQEAKRRVVLGHVAQVFEPGIRYPEREVDTLLRAFWHDHASLRRYLVDSGFLSRDAGEYWRSGGVVAV